MVPWGEAVAKLLMAEGSRVTAAQNVLQYGMERIANHSIAAQNSRLTNLAKYADTVTEPPQSFIAQKAGSEKILEKVAPSP